MPNIDDFVLDYGDLRKLESDLKANKPLTKDKILASLNKLKDTFSTMQQKLHEELYNFQQNNLDLSSSKSNIKSSSGNNAQQIRFNEFIEAAMSRVNGAIDFIELRKDLKKLIKLFGYILKHYRACTQYSQCNDNVGRSL